MRRIGIVVAIALGFSVAPARAASTDQPFLEIGNSFNTGDDYTVNEYRYQPNRDVKETGRALTFVGGQKSELRLITSRNGEFAGLKFVTSKGHLDMLRPALLKEVAFGRYDREGLTFKLQPGFDTSVGGVLTISYMKDRHVDQKSPQALTPINIQLKKIDGKWFAFDSTSSTQQPIKSLTFNPNRVDGGLAGVKSVDIQEHDWKVAAPTTKPAVIDEAPASEKPADH